MLRKAAQPDIKFMGLWLFFPFSKWNDYLKTVFCLCLIFTLVWQMCKNRSNQEGGKYFIYYSSSPHRYFKGINTVVLIYCHCFNKIGRNAINVRILSRNSVADWRKHHRTLKKKLTSRLNKYQGSSCFSWNVQRALVDFLQRTLQMPKSKSTSVERGESGLIECTQNHIVFNKQGSGESSVKMDEWFL